MKESVGIDAPKNALISVDEALKILRENIHAMPAVSISLNDALHRVSSDDIHARISMPPFNRSAMDGYALKFADLAETEKFIVDGVLPAGQSWNSPVEKYHAVRIMTGAPLPDNCDCVIPVENSVLIDESSVEFTSKPKKAWSHIAKKGEEYSEGQILIKKGELLNPPHLAFLAQNGYSKVSVYSKPKINILATGSELVSVEDELKPGQMRESNTWSLRAQCEIWGAESKVYKSVDDDKNALTEQISSALDSDILIICGGVSMGDFDLVPSILKELGVEIHFHKVNQKPGKPILFGTLGNKPVFGLPGNPVASLIGFELYIGPAIKWLSGDTNFETEWISGFLGEDFNIKSDRVLFNWCRARVIDGRMEVFSIPSSGSADIASVMGANCFAKFESGEYIVTKGTQVKLTFFRGASIGA